MTLERMIVGLMAIEFGMLLLLVFCLWMVEGDTTAQIMVGVSYLAGGTAVKIHDLRKKEKLDGN